MVTKLKDFSRSKQSCMLKKWSNISELVQDRDVVATYHQQEVLYGPSIFADLE